jgi:Mn2+/Fe2+ NRAMP family transporter
MTIPVDDAVIYDQRCQDFRSLNGFLWQSPLIIMTLTGGLWFAVASFDMSTGARSMLLIFAGLANLIMIGALVRLRLVMQSVLTDIRKLDNLHKIRFGFTIVILFSLLLLMAAIGSFVAGACPQKYFTKGAEAAPVQPTPRAPPIAPVKKP